MVRTLLIDNYDSFTYNLAELLTAVNGTTPTVVTNDVPWETLDFTAFDNVVISPGPGDPTLPGDFGVSARVITDSGLPLLGVCLGHQGVCAAFGAAVVRTQPMHGRASTITHVGRDLFAAMPSPISAVRYHSLVAVEVPDELEVLATTAEGLVMAVRHRERPLWGVQFHPESIASEHGLTLLANFRDLCRQAGAVRTRVSDVAAPDAAGETVARGPEPGDPASLRPSAGASAGHNLRHRRIDHEPDPSLLYRSLFAGRRGAFWLDGSAGSGFTVMGDGTGPLAECLTYDVNTARVRVEHGCTVEEFGVTSIFDELERRLREREVSPDPALPFDFHLGYVGYLGYELKAETGGLNAHRSPYPDAALTFADRAVVIDHDRGCTYLLALGAAGDWFDRVGAAVCGVDPPGGRAPAALLTRRDDAAPHLRHDAGAYRVRIEASLDLIAAGQTYEVCLTNTARVERAVDPLATFDRARALNPAPYAALLEFTGMSVISASPERFVRIRNDRSVESKPIKGTRPRGVTASEDAALRDALRASEKERAENLMIIDLVRNDLSRVCAPGSVHVPELFGIESYAAVHQMVSTVRGVLRRDAHPVQAVRALFPAGSMTGAPKVRTMEILDALEGGPRGVYSGALGYLSLSGAVDLSVVIRTMVATPTSVEFGVGGAITALSDPAEEYAEILVKAISSQRVLAGEDDAVICGKPYLTVVGK